MKKFNELFKKIILEEAQNSDEETKKKLCEIYGINEFYDKYLSPLMNSDSSLQVSKENGNSFLVNGLIDEICKFFNDIKVDECFMENPKEFKVYSPLLSVGNDIELLKDGDMYPSYHLMKYNVPCSKDLDNINRYTCHGQWFSLNDENNVRIKGITPSELSKLIKKIGGKNNIKVYVQFTVNTEKMPNTVWDEMTEFVTDPDKIGVSDDKTKFDYDKFIKPNVK